MSLRRKPPKRNVRNVHSNGKTTTGITTNNQNETIQFESGAEDILQLSFLRDRTIKRLVSQPMEIPYYDEEGKLRTYYPDYLIERIDGSIEIYEFTLSSRRFSPKGIARERGAKQYCDEKGWKYIVHTELDLPSKTYQDNLQALFGFCAFAYDNEDVYREITRLLSDCENKLFSTLISELKMKFDLEEGIINAVIFHRMWFCDLCTDFNELIFVEGFVNHKMKDWLLNNKANI